MIRRSKQRPAGLLAQDVIKTVENAVAILEDAMKILFIASRFPYPPYQGDRWRAFHQLRGLAQSHEVTLVTPAPDHDLHESLEIVRPLCKHLEVVPSSRWRRLARLVQAPVSVLPMQTLYSFEPGMLQTVRRLLATRTFDLAHVQLV